MLTGQIINNQACCVKFIIGEYEVSLACDTSCSNDGKLRRFYVKVFRDDEDVTHEILTIDEIVNIEYDDFLDILKQVKDFSNTYKVV